MKTHDLVMSDFLYPGKVVQFLENEGLEEGDILKVKTEEQKNSAALMAVVVVVVIAVIYFFHKARKNRLEDGEKMLDELFKNKTIEEIEEGMMEEYGIKIEIEQKQFDEEREDWQLLSSQNFIKEYSIDEPEYTDADVKEPNPLYRTWKEK